MMTTTRRRMLRASAAGLAMTALAGTGALAQSYGGTLNVGLTYEIDTMNTYSTGYLADAQHVVIEGLLAPDENAQYVPVLATEVPTIENGGIVVSEDGETMTITYKLREGVKWHDGDACARVEEGRAEEGDSERPKPLPDAELAAASEVSLVVRSEALSVVRWVRTGVT